MTDPTRIVYTGYNPATNRVVVARLSTRPHAPWYRHATAATETVVDIVTLDGETYTPAERQTTRWVGAPYGAPAIARAVAAGAAAAGETEVTDE